MTSASSVIPVFLDELRLARKSPHTVKTYAQGLKLFLEIAGKNDELSEENFIKFLRKTGKIHPSTQAVYRVALSRLYEYHSPGIPLKLLIERYGQKKPKRFIVYTDSTEEAIEKVLAYADSLRGDLLALRDRAFILTLPDTGLRISEACSLLRGDIDYDRKRALIIGKGDKPGIVRFSDQSIDAIRLYLSARAELDGKSGKPLEKLPLFARHDRGAGKKVKPVEAGGMWAALCIRFKEAGIGPGILSPHKFRHYFVTMILRETGNIAKAQELARHEDINTTRGYSHLSETELDQVYDEIFNKR